MSFIPKIFEFPFSGYVARKFTFTSYTALKNYKTFFKNELKVFNLFSFF